MSAQSLNRTSKLVINSGVRVFTVFGLSLCLSISGYSQFGILFYAANGAAHEIVKAKKSKLVKKYARNVFIDTDSVTVLRVPEEKIRGNARAKILIVQSLLDKANRSYLSQELINTDEILSETYVIPALDNDWDIELYKNEINAYSKYNQALRERRRKAEHEAYIKETRRRDSIRIEQEKRRQFVFDSLSIVRKDERRRNDSLEIEFRTKGFHFVNVKDAILKEKPLEKSRDLASVGGTSYVKILSKATNGYVQIEVSDLVGYIREQELVGSLYHINYEGADVEFAKNMYTASLTETTEQSRYNDKVYRKLTPQYNAGRKYYRGPRGGCYYYSASGKKVYVDHSYCN